MEFIRLLVLALYLATPVFLLYRWIKLAGSGPGRRRWPMPAALGLWLLQFLTLAYFIVICMSGHCNPTPLEEHGPVVLLVLAYAGIGGMLWLSRTPKAR